MKRKTTLMFLCLLFLICFQIWSVTWYVDNAANKENTGLSWENAWQSFKDIKWDKIKPGDTLYISGGKTSKLYKEILQVGASGEPNKPITIRVGQEKDHNGKVIITSDERWGGVFVIFVHHVIIDGEFNNKPHIIIMDCANFGVYVYVADNIVLKHLEITHNGYGYKERGGDGIRIYFEKYVMFICEISHCIIHNNYQDQIVGLNGNIDVDDFGYLSVHHCEIYNINDDGFEAGLGGIDFYNNIMYGRINDGGGGHPDGVYFGNGYCRIYNNIFYNFSNGKLVSNAFIGMSLRSQPIDNVWTKREATHIYIHNNLMYENVKSFVGNYLRGIAIGGAPNNVGVTNLTNVVVSNNTLVGTPAWGLLLGLSELSANSTENDIMFLNNVFYNCHAYGGGKVYNLVEKYDSYKFSVGSYGDDADIITDYNCINKGPEGTESIGFKAVPYENLTKFNEATGCEKHSIRENPLLSMDTYMPLSKKSPIVDSGLDLSFIYNDNPYLEFMKYDLNGNKRTPGSWDMGAFEYTEED